MRYATFCRTSISDRPSGCPSLGIVRVKSEARNSLFMKVGGEGVETRVVDTVLEIRSATRMLGYLNAASPVRRRRLVQHQGRRRGEERLLQGDRPDLRGHQCRRAEIHGFGSGTRGASVRRHRIGQGRRQTKPDYGAACRTHGSGKRRLRDREKRAEGVSSLATAKSHDAETIAGGFCFGRAQVQKSIANAKGG